MKDIFDNCEKWIQKNDLMQDKGIQSIWEYLELLKSQSDSPLLLDQTIAEYDLIHFDELELRQQKLILL